MAAGAATGVGIDLLVGGVTLGAAAVLGALLGGGAQTLRSYGSRLKGKLKGQRELTVDDAVLRLLALRQQLLLQALEVRGHAAVDTLKLAAPQDQTWREGKLPDTLHKARAHPEWSSLNPGAQLEQVERQEQVSALSATLTTAS
ncbi:hypothetical protein D9M68_811340 [compost metagenome]